MSDILTAGNEMDKRLESLIKVRVNESKWETYYLDESTGEKWIKEYPNSACHGGGVPQLRKIDKFPWE